MGDKSEEREGIPGGTAAPGVAVVIGAGDGTGRAISRRFARAYDKSPGEVRPGVSRQQKLDIQVA